MVAREKLETAAKTLDIRSLFITSIVTALAFVVGLFWNDAIKSTIETVIPTGEKLTYKYVAAAIVTILVAFTTWLLYRSQAVKARDVAKAVERERLLALERFTKSREFLKLPRKDRERIKRNAA